MSRLRDLARQEQAALLARRRSDADWRDVWWRLTFALGKSGIGAYEEIADVLEDVSRAYIAQRVRLGEAILRRPDIGGPLRPLPQVIRTLPPRHALELVCRAGVQVLDDTAVAELQRAEREKVSLRAFAEALGTQPPSWRSAAQVRAADEAARTAPPTPEVVREIIRTSPEHARAVAADAPAMTAVAEARNHVVADRTPVAAPPPRPGDVQDDRRNALMADLYAIHQRLSDAHRHLADVALDSAVRDGALGLARTNAELASKLVDRITGDAEFDADLRALLEVQS